MMVRSGTCCEAIEGCDQMPRILCTCGSGQLCQTIMLPQSNRPIGYLCCVCSPSKRPYITEQIAMAMTIKPQQLPVYHGARYSKWMIELHSGDFLEIHLSCGRFSATISSWHDDGKSGFDIVHSRTCKHDEAIELALKHDIRHADGSPVAIKPRAYCYSASD